MPAKIRGPLGDSFQRPDGPIGGGWTVGHDWDDTAYEELGILGGAVVVSDPVSRVGANYAANQNQSRTALAAAGEQWLGIGCAWRNTGYSAARVATRWTGANHNTGVPLVHVTPGTDQHAVGSWIGLIGGFWLVSVEVIGHPPENLASDAFLDFGTIAHTDGTPLWHEIRTDGEAVTIWVNDQQVELAEAGFNPKPIPAPLRGSTMHGFGLDTHLYTPVEDIPTRPCLTEWRCTYL